MDEDASSGKQYPTRSHRRWFRTVLALVGLLVVGLLAGIWVTREPAVMYAGQPLEVYLGDLVYPAGDPKYRSATNALHALGEAALPVIARAIARPVPWYAVALNRWGDRLSPRIRVKLNGQLKPYRTAQRRTGAGVALSLLGTNAAPIAGDVMRAFGRLEHADQAVMVQWLPPVGSALVPHLKPYLTNQYVPTRSLAAFVIHQLGPRGSAAVPELVEGIEGGDPNHLRLVAQTLARVGDVGRAAMTNLLHSPQTVRRLVGLEALSGAPGVARWSAPELVRLLTDPEIEVRASAAAVLAKTLPMPLDYWWERLQSLPRTHPAFETYESTLKLVLDSRAIWVSALREGLLSPSIDVRLDAAAGLLNLDAERDEVEDCLREVLAPRAGKVQPRLVQHLQQANQLQQRLVGLRRLVPETKLRPDTVPTRQSPASPGPPPPGKLP